MPASLSGPLVVICIPTYQSGSTLRETLTSLLNQSYRNLVIHVSDNSSSDDTLQVAAACADARVHVHPHSENIGAEGNFTRCMKLASGAYTAIFHADDVYRPDAVEKMVNYLELHPEVEAAVSQAETIDDASRTTGMIDMIPPVPAGEVRQYAFHTLLKDLFRFQNRIVIAGLMVRSSVFREHITAWGDGSFKSASDVDMYLRLSRRAPIAVFGDRLIKYRISEKQYSQRIRNRLTRPDFFLLTDGYVEATRHEGILDAVDLRNLEWLERHDRVARAMNAVVAQQFDLARNLLKGTMCRDAVHAAVASRRGRVTLAAAAVLVSLDRVRLLQKSSAMIRRIKKIKWQ